MQNLYDCFGANIGLKSKTYTIYWQLKQIRVENMILDEQTTDDL